MADVKFVEQKKIRLLRGIVYNGGVFSKGDVLSVDAETAARLIANEDAEALIPEAPKPAPAKEKADK